MNTPSQRDPQTLERQADQIRADMDRTLDALERKLSPSQLLDRSLDYLRAHSGDVARAVGETVRRNPVPIALAAAGIGCLIASSLRSRRNFDDTFGDESPYLQPRARRGRFHDRFAATRERIRSSRDAAADKLAQAADATRAQTQRAQDR